METRKTKISDNDARSHFSAWGNENIIRNYVAYFEKRMESEIAELDRIEYDISSAYYPNFAAWIRLYSELICNSLYWKLFRYEGDWGKIQWLPFRKARNIIVERIEKETTILATKINRDDLTSMIEDINLVLNLRHSFQHGGLPNPMRDLWYGSDEEKFIRMLNPKNHKETKEIFVRAEKLIKLLPQLTIIITEG